MSLLQGVLRSTAGDPSQAIERRLNSLNLSSTTNANHTSGDDSDDELVAVTSGATTPSRTRPPSPKSGAASRRIPGPLHLTPTQRDPLRVFPTDVSQRIFSELPLRDLARCALVSKKWSRSQTINYVWFQYYRKENFQDESLPPGKWTKRESKQNWRTTHLKSSAKSDPTKSTSRYGSGYASPSLGSGVQTPRELKEEQWKAEAEAAAKPGKVEMREMYKELGGRKHKGKGKLGASGVARDKGGWSDAGADEFW